MATQGWGFRGLLWLLRPLRHLSETYCCGGACIDSICGSTFMKSPHVLWHWSLIVRLLGVGGSKALGCMHALLERQPTFLVEAEIVMYRRHSPACRPP